MSFPPTPAPASVSMDNIDDLKLRLRLLLRSAKRLLTREEIIDALAVDISAETFHIEYRPALEALLTPPSPLAGLLLPRSSDAAGHAARPHWSREHNEYRVDALQLSDSTLPEDEASSHSFLAQTSLLYLRTIAALRPLPPRRDILNRYPFAFYAARFWPDHALHSESLYDLTAINLQVAFLTSAAYTRIWLLLHDEEDVLLREPPIPRRYDWVPAHRGALYHAAFWGLSQAMHRLLSSTCGPVAIKSDQEAQEALYAASFRGHEGLVRDLLASGVTVDAEYGPFESPLAAAAAGGREEIVRILLDAGAILADEEDDSHPLVIAAVTRHVAVLRVLAPHTPQALLDYTLLVVALRLHYHSYDAVVRELLLSGADPLSPAGGGDACVLELVLERGGASTARLVRDYADATKIEPRLERCLQLAATNGDTDLVESFLERVEKSRRGNLGSFLDQAKIINATQSGDIGAVTELLGHMSTSLLQATHDRDNRSLLRMAARGSQTRILELLLHHIAQDSSQISPELEHILLLDAVSLADDSTINLLLERATLTVDTEHLHMALSRGRPSIFHRLLAALKDDCDLANRNAQGSTILHTLVAGQHYSSEDMEGWVRRALEALLAHSVPLEAKDGLGRTAMHSAVAMGNLEAVQLLLQSGARSDAVTCEEIPEMRYPFAGDIRACKRLIEGQVR